MGVGRHFKGEKKVRDWGEYNEGLKKRYDITLWIEEAVLEKPERGKKQGRSHQYSDAFIQMGITLKALFRLPYRGLEGFVRSILRLMGKEIVVPDFSTFSRRNGSQEITVEANNITDGKRHIVVDTTGLKIYGEGEWKVRQHGWSKHRTWRKLHVMVDEGTQQIVTADLTENNIGDQEHLGSLLAALPESLELEQVTGDGIYDTHACYRQVKNRKARLVTPPRKNAADPPPDQPLASLSERQQAIRECHEKGRTQWKREQHYHRRSLAETSFSRFKTYFTDKLFSRTFSRQRNEAFIKCNILNSFRSMATPAYAS
jgi:hypothetical protein